jgi:hypothetical protein
MTVPTVANQPFWRYAAALALPTLGAAPAVVGASPAVAGSVALLSALYSKVDKNGKKGTARPSSGHSTFLPYSRLVQSADALSLAQRVQLRQSSPFAVATQSSVSPSHESEGENAMEGRESGPGLKSASEMFKKLSKSSDQTQNTKRGVVLFSRMLE